MDAEQLITLGDFRHKLDIITSELEKRLPEIKDKKIKIILNAKNDKTGRSAFLKRNIKIKIIEDKYEV